jgi:hypothetical protein
MLRRNCGHFMRITIVAAKVRYIIAQDSSLFFYKLYIFILFMINVSTIVLVSKICFLVQ